METLLPYWFTVLFNMLRYAVLGGMAFLSFYVLWPNVFAKSKIQTRFARKKDFVRELSYSLQTIVIFIGMNLLTIFNNTRIRQCHALVKSVLLHKMPQDAINFPDIGSFSF